MAWVCLALLAVMVFTARWWWQKLAALPLASMVAALSIGAGREADRHRALLARLEAIASDFCLHQDVPPGLIPYLDPMRASNRTGQIVYQFIRPPILTAAPTGKPPMTTTLEQLIASFLQIGLAKIDSKLSATTQQMIDAAVPTLVSTIASVVVDLAENHKTAKASATK
jgi:hypothetical protein